MNKLAQTWSFDLIVAVILFIVIVAVFYSFLSTDTNREVTIDLQVGAESIAAGLDCDISPDSGVCIIEEGSIDDGSLDTFLNTPYDTIKSELGITGDFCVYLRDKDTGALVPFTDSGGTDYIGVGKADTYGFFDMGAGTVYCGDPIP